ncbi:MAG: hypothetical protein QOG49_1293 [Frankiaceae bacterium]|nr:hypothetical protein [Frankiaceae bacterium]
MTLARCARVAALGVVLVLGSASPAWAHGGTGSSADAYSDGLILAAALAAFWWLNVRDQAKGDPRMKRKQLVIGAVVIVAIAAAATAGLWAPKKKASTARPTTTARLAILSPQTDQVVPLHADIKVQLTGGTLLNPAVTKGNGGHLHVSVDGALISMTDQLDQQVTLTPGRHTVTAEYVAPDHASFKTPVLAAVIFEAK